MLALCVDKIELLVVVSLGNDGGSSNYTLGVGSVWFNSLIGVHFVRTNVIDVIKEVWIITEGVMPSEMRHVEECFTRDSGDDTEWAHSHVPHFEGEVLSHPEMVSGFAVGSWQSSVNSVSVCSPHVVDSFFNLIVKCLLSNQSWSQQHKGSIERVDFEKSYK